jgi:phosphate transport system substrate-binding protein
VKTTRLAQLVAISAVGALSLAACSSSSSSSGGSSASGGSIDCATGSIKASGSSAQKNAITEWINTYQQACNGATINYQANGSGAGIKDFINKQTAFAGSDSALKDEDRTKADARCATGPAIDIPMVGGAIAVAYNVQGVDKLVLTPQVISGIFSNKITKWNDPAITALNSGVSLPDASIAQFHRSDSSGTTENFTKYLKAAAGSDWTFDSGKEWKAPGGQGAKGSDGVASAVKSTPNSIGYMELSFVQDAGVSAAWVDNGGGPVEATSQNAASTIANATVKGTGNDLALSIDYTVKTPGAYPLVLVTYEITCEKGLSATDLPLTKSFLTFAASDQAQGQLTDAGYVPITGDLLTKVRSSVASIS